MRVLWIAPRPVWPTRGGGQIRTAGLISAALAAGHEVLVAQPAGPPATSPLGVLTIDLPKLRGPHIVTAKVVSRHPLRSPRLSGSAYSRASTAIGEFGPNVAVVSEVHAAGVARKLLPRVPWIYDSHNVEHELYSAMLRTAQAAFDRLTLSVDKRRVAATERRLVGAANVVICVSEADAHALQALAPRSWFEVVPSSVPTPSRVGNPAKAGPVVLFVGSLDFPPNIEAVEELVLRVMPVVRSHQRHARLVIAGRRPPARIRALLAQQPWCSLREDVPELASEYAEARCTVLPIRSGSGSRLKVYEALSYGLPVIATDEAIAGVPLHPGQDVVVANSSTQLAEACVAVLSDDAWAQRLGRRGRSTFDRDLSWNAAGGRFVEVLEAVASQPPSLLNP